MKYANKLVATVAIFSMILTFGCGGGGDPTPEGVPGEALAATWVQDDAGDVAGGPAAEDFTAFEITINTTTTPGILDYTTQNTNTLIFPNSGTFTLPENPNFSTGAQVTRDNEVQVDIALTASGQLRMVFLVDSNSSIPHNNGRTAEIGGTYTFLLDKQE